MSIVWHGIYQAYRTFMGFPQDPRPFQDIREHYSLELSLSNRLRRATREERRRLYTPVYDELFNRIPKTESESDEAASAARQLAFLRPFLRTSDHFLEVGAGQCLVANGVADLVDTVFALDVSEELLQRVKAKQNVKLVLSDGLSIPVGPESIDIAYSNQLMEHLLLEDGALQLSNIYQALRAGGRYICVTPNALSGPHDVSQWFDSEATGFHLKEYMTGELAELFRQAGFRRVTAFVGPLTAAVPVAVAPIAALESALMRLPAAIRTGIARTLPLRLLLGIKVMGVK